GDLITRGGGTVINHYVITLGPNGGPARLELTQRKVDASIPPNAPNYVTVAYGPDTMTTVIMRDSAITRALAVKDAFPVFGNSMAAYEIFLSRLRATKADSGAVAALGVNAGATALRAPPPPY